MQICSGFCNELRGGMDARTKADPTLTWPIGLLIAHCGPRMCSATSNPVAERPAYTRREIDYPAIGRSLAVTGCSSIN
jgi:hypothetical protein